MSSIFNLEILTNNIIELCRKNEISVNRMLKECGLSKSIVDNLKRGFDPQLSKIVIIADYFGVTVDYLINNTSPSGTERETNYYKYLEEKKIILCKKNKLVGNFENYLQTVPQISCAVTRIDINYSHSLLSNLNNMSLFLVDDTGGIGGEFTIDESENKYSISDFVALINYCFLKGWKVTDSCESWYDLQKKELKNEFEITRGKNL